MELGFLTLIPTIILFVVIILTRRVLLSLLIATIAACIIKSGSDFLESWSIAVQDAFAGGFLNWLLLLMALFGIYIVMLEKSGAAREFAGWISKFADTDKKALLLTELLGIIIFIDDALNNVVVGTSMKKLTDSHRVPRTLLGYITISTSAPVCILLPISTWAVMAGGIMIDYGVSVNNNAADTFARAVPYMFFGWATLLVVTFVIMKWIPLIGVTKRDTVIARETGVVLTKEEARDNKEIKAELFDSLRRTCDECSPWKFLLPNIVLIAATILSDNNVLIGCMLGIAACIIIMKFWNRESTKSILDCGMEGISSMLFLFVQMTLAVTLMMLNSDIGMPAYIVETVSPYLNGIFLPVLSFVIFTAYSAFGGGFWEMCMLFLPVVLPLSQSIGANPYLCAAAVVSAAAAGSSLFVCGDTIALVSSVVGTKPNVQASAILPYALIAVAISAGLYLVFGLAGW